MELRALSGPNLVEQRVGVIRGGLVSQLPEQADEVRADRFAQIVPHGPIIMNRIQCTREVILEH